MKLVSPLHWRSDAVTLCLCESRAVNSEQWTLNTCLPACPIAAPHRRSRTVYVIKLQANQQRGFLKRFFHESSPSGGGLGGGRAGAATAGLSLTEMTHMAGDKSCLYKKNWFELPSIIIWLHLSSLRNATVSQAVCVDCQEGSPEGLPGACKWKMAKLCFKKRKKFWILLYKVLYRLKKGQLLNKFSKISKPTNLRKGQIWFFWHRNDQTWQPSGSAG